MTTKKDPYTIKAGLSNFTGTENYYIWNSLFRKYWLTDGSRYVAEECSAYWLMDAIASHQCTTSVSREPFQTWTLRKATEDESGEGWLLVATDGDDREIARQEIGFSTFPLDEITLWLEENVILLPSEH